MNNQKKVTHYAYNSGDSKEDNEIKISLTELYGGLTFPRQYVCIDYEYFNNSYNL